MDITSVFLTTLTPLAVALYVIGLFCKNSKKIKDEAIPFILMFLGIVGAIGLMPIQDKYTLTEAVIQGVLAAGMAVLTNQSYVQLKKSGE